MSRSSQSSLEASDQIGVSEYAARWIDEIARQQADFDVELLDLKDYPMPVFVEEASPSATNRFPSWATVASATLAPWSNFGCTGLRCTWRRSGWPFTSPADLSGGCHIG